MAGRVGNSHGLCTWEEDAGCESCPDRFRLNCRWDGRLLLAFLMAYSPFMVCSWFGMAIVAKVSGAWWYLVANAAFYIFFFGFFEIRILCSHCPFYGGDSGFTLRCLANHGAMKLWKYRPGPMNRFERASLMVGFAFLGGFPVFANFYGVYHMATNYAAFGQAALLGMICIAVATLVSGLSFFTVLFVYVCPRCVNFSCPLNRVPREAMDAYLERNQVMKEAWKEGAWPDSSPKV